MRVVYSDASDTGYGGYVVEHGPCVAYGPRMRPIRAPHGESSQQC